MQAAEMLGSLQQVQSLTSMKQQLFEYTISHRRQSACSIALSKASDTLLVFTVPQGKCIHPLLQRSRMQEPGPQDAWAAALPCVSLGRGTHLEGAAAEGGLPPPLLGVLLAPGLHSDTVCNKEGGVEAHTKSPNEVCIALGLLEGLCVQHPASALFTYQPQHSLLITEAVCSLFLSASTMHFLACLLEEWACFT